MTLAEVLQTHWPAYRAQFGPLLPEEQVAAVRAIVRCRTPALGGQRYQCACGQSHYAWHSCRVKGFASRGFVAAGMLGEIMPKLLVQEAPPSATLEESHSAKGVLLLKIRLVIDQAPRSAKGSSEGQALAMHCHTPAQITGEANVEARIRFGMEHVDVEHLAPGL